MEKHTLGLNYWLYVEALQLKPKRYIQFKKKAVQYIIDSLKASTYSLITVYSFVSI